jgi:hypothetical protein
VRTQQHPLEKSTRILVDSAARILVDSAERDFQLLQPQPPTWHLRRPFGLKDVPMPLSAEPDFYLVDGETFAALKRIVRRLHSEDSLIGEDRRTLAVRMNALLQRAQPEGRVGSPPTTDSDPWGGSSSLLKESFWKHRAQA